MIYYVEDDANVRELALYALAQSGLQAKGFPEAEPFYEACKETVPDLILLDIMLPHTDGLTILRELRRDPSLANVPVMMLTAKGTEIDKVTGLDAGADDYLAKPFGMMELVSRCNALLRRASRSEAPHDAIVSCGDITIDTDAHDVHVNGVQVELTLKEFSLLQTLIENRGHVLSRAQLLKEVWDTDYVGETRTVDTHVQTLRKKLNDVEKGAGDVIQTVRGVGYRARSDA
ncbi:MAG: response regulator transcription factor [Eggerthellaceae bacterium]|jgi:two-component system alkaline phosphatase synthesis response regulator PhoP|nr:response regulator transcription factor [Eggerthellaceae bacterium]